MNIQRTMIRSAGLLVPAPQRDEWLSEWRAELWYVRQTRPAATFAFALGAFQDAFWLRRGSRGGRLLESPLHCGLFLAMLAVGSVVITVLLAGGRNVLLRPPFPDAENLILISGDRPLNPTISFHDYERLVGGARQRFMGLAFYEVDRMQVGKAALSVARASGNLFELLDIPLAGAGSGARVVLSEKTWRKYFGRDAHVVGRGIDIDGIHAVVAGIVPADAWRLPGRVDAWLLLDEARGARSMGFAIGRLGALSFRPRTDRLGMWRLAVINDDGDFDSYDCESLAAWGRQPLNALLVAFIYICVFLSATTSLAFGTRKLRQWVFFAAKVACIIPILYCCGALAFTYIGSALSIPFYLAMFPGGFFAFRWVVEDQRRRCPVCLRLLSKPVGFGEASHMFLGWYGTELTCVRGHGLLRVPEIPSTYFSTQRWLEADDLFALRW